MALSTTSSDEIKRNVTNVWKSSGSSGGGYVADEKKRKRMESNRESARRSRQRKQEHLDNLIKEVGRLKRENEGFAKKIGEFTGMFDAMHAQNEVLNGEKDRLVARLESLENIIEIAKVVRGSSNGGVGGNGDGGMMMMYEGSDDPMMKPWQLPRPSLPIFASSSGFRFDA